MRKRFTPSVRQGKIARLERTLDRIDNREAPDYPQMG